MNKKTYSPYATNKGGKIDSPRAKGESEPKVTVTKGNDLRAGRRGN